MLCAPLCTFCSEVIYTSSEFGNRVRSLHKWLARIVDEAFQYWTVCYAFGHCSFNRLPERANAWLQPCRYPPSVSLACLHTYLLAIRSVATLAFAKTVDVDLVQRWFVDSLVEMPCIRPQLCGAHTYGYGLLVRTALFSHSSIFVGSVNLASSPPPGR